MTQENLSELAVDSYVEPRHRRAVEKYRNLEDRKNTAWNDLHAFEVVRDTWKKVMETKADFDVEDAVLALEAMDDFLTVAGRGIRNME